MMITICHPVDDLELQFIQLELEAADIPHFVVGQYFGGLYPGMQMPWYNERSVQVPAACLDDALEVIQHVRSYYSPLFENLALKSRFRIFLEMLLFGWMMPAGSRKSTGPVPKRDLRKSAEAP
jgi:hypothetical protein